MPTVVIGNSIIKQFTDDVCDNARAELDAAERKFAGKPDKFRQWMTRQHEILRERMTVAAWVEWQARRATELQPQLDAEGAASIREFEAYFSVALGRVSAAARAEYARKNPPKDDGGLRVPPTAAEIYDAFVRGRLNVLPESNPGKIPPRGMRRTMRRVGAV